MNGVTVIVCVLWGQHRLIESVRVSCFLCDCDVALDAKNQKLIEDCTIRPMCLSCYNLRGSPRPHGALVRGRLIRITRPENN